MRFSFNSKFFHSSGYPLNILLQFFDTKRQLSRSFEESACNILHEISAGNVEMRSFLRVFPRREYKYDIVFRSDFFSSCNINAFTWGEALPRFDTSEESTENLSYSVLAAILEEG